MKTMLAVCMVIGVIGTSARAERPLLGGRESPRATDLLRAEKLAEQARKRLEMPAPRSGGWKRGGSSWGESGARPADAQDVIINVHPQRRRPR